MSRNAEMFSAIPAERLRIDNPDFKAGAWEPTRVRGEDCEMSLCFEWIGGKWEGFVAIRKAPR
jgi:hypothetical protein